MSHRTDEGFVRAINGMTAALESQLSLIDSRLIDPNERFLGPDGEQWDAIGGGGALSDRLPYQTEQGLADCRRVGRWLWRENPFAQNGHENRISYVVGTGHVYSVVAAEDASPSDRTLRRVQNVVDDFLKFNRWRSRQKETLLRIDRDGECLLRVFQDFDAGILKVRFVEPESIFCPAELDNREECSFGVETDPDDVETIVRYYVDEEPVEASQIQHRKWGVDSACKRGLPIYWPVRHNLTRATKILRNGSTVTEIQTAIGMIRKFVRSTSQTVQAWADQSANVKQTSDSPGFGTGASSTLLHQRIPPGAIINATGGMEYEFPGMGINPAQYVEALQAELRAVASRLVMPEWMFSAKSDDVNRASALVSEGPSTKMFERLQWDMIESDLELINACLDFAVAARRITPEERNSVTVDARGPMIVTRDRLKDSQARQIDMQAGILSPQTATAEAGYEYHQEQANIEDHEERLGGVPTKERPDDFLTPKPDEDTGGKTEPKPDEKGNENGTQS